MAGHELIDQLGPALTLRYGEPTLAHRCGERVALAARENVHPSAVGDRAGERLPLPGGREVQFARVTDGLRDRRDELLAAGGGVLVVGVGLNTIRAAVNSGLCVVSTPSLRKFLPSS